MCGRYYIDTELPEDILRIVMNPGNLHVNIAERDIHPSDMAPVIIGEGNALQATDMKWGMLSEKDGSLLINARAESVMDKKSFTESALSRRCIVPARYFYEWDHDKNKCRCVPRSGTLFMAGIYKRCAGEERFTIITTAANASMEGIHERMPLIIPEKQAGSWIADGTRVFEFLKTSSSDVRVEKDYEQLSFF